MSGADSHKVQEVKVVVPLYRWPLPPEEERALRNNLEKLSAHPVAVVAPEGLDLSTLENEYPAVETIRVSDHWLGTRRGIRGYNDMMLSGDFYRLFADCRYIFICHTDAWIFRDDLPYWLSKDYDVVAAPWISKPLSRIPPVKAFLKAWRSLTGHSRKRRPDLDGRVGNGGLSLRRVDSFIRACVDSSEEIARYKSADAEAFNEDIFWATVPLHFRYPAPDEALRFAIDCKPGLALRRLRNLQIEIPMGAHGYTLPSRLDIWLPVISQTK